MRKDVIMIQKNTMTKQLQNFAQEAENKFGIKVFQIHNHKDEGYLNGKTWKPNCHAYMFLMGHKKMARVVSWEI